MSNLITTTNWNGSHENDVLSLTREEIKILIAFHDIAQRYDWGIVCSKCQRNLQGTNARTDRILAVTCHCTEYRCDR